RWLFHESVIQSSPSECAALCGCAATAHDMGMSATSGRCVAKYGLVFPCLEAQGEIVEAYVERIVLRLNSANRSWISALSINDRTQTLRRKPPSRMITGPNQRYALGQKREIRAQ